VATVFFGRFEHSLDTKGRLILPAKFRAQFERGGYLGKHHERCLALWPEDQFALRIDQMRETQELGQDERNLARFWAQGLTEVEVTASGRMAIPAYLRDYARLEGDVLVNGALDRIELWNPALFEERVAPIESQLTAETT
jgi:transcriptional regulator MraZ